MSQPATGLHRELTLTAVRPDAAETATAAARQPRIPGMIHTSGRPAEAGDRAVPGYWAGDPILGKANRSAIGTRVGRSTGSWCCCTCPTDTTRGRSGTA